MIGKLTCWDHGATAGPNGKQDSIEKGDANAIVATLLADPNERRSLYEILEDCLHGADVLFRAAQQDVINGEGVTIDQINRLSQSLQYAHAIANACARLGIMERRVEAEERYGALVQDMMRRVFDDLGLTASQHAKLGEVMPRRLRELGHQIDAWQSNGQPVRAELLERDS